MVPGSSVRIVVRVKHHIGLEKRSAELLAERSYFYKVYKTIYPVNSNQRSDQQFNNNICVFSIKSVISAVDTGLA